MDSRKIQDVRKKKRAVEKQPPPVVVPAPAIETTEARRGYETTAAYELQVALHNWVCIKCKANRPGVYSTDGRTRYVRCRRCGATDKIVV